MIHHVFRVCSLLHHIFVIVCRLCLVSMGMNVSLLISFDSSNSNSITNLSLFFMNHIAGDKKNLNNIFIAPVDRLRFYARNICTMKSEIWWKKMKFFFRLINSVWDEWEAGEESDIWATWINFIGKYAHVRGQFILIQFHTQWLNEMEAYEEHWTVNIESYLVVVFSWGRRWWWLVTCHASFACFLHEK